MPRVLLTGFCAVPGPRRAGVQLRHVIRALTPQNGVDLLVVREGDQGYVERQGSVRVLRVPTHEADRRSQIQTFQRALRRQLDGADYDVIHCRDSWSGMTVLEAKPRFGFAVVYDLSRSPLGEAGADLELDAQYTRDEDACVLAADVVLAPTPAAVKALQGRGRSERVFLSPLGVDIDRFDWDAPPASGPPKILYVGAIDPGRGVRVLVRALAEIVRETDARLVLAGPIAPKFEPPLREGIRELGLTDKVELMGAVDHDQMPALIASSTVCVVPSAQDLAHPESAVYPTKVLEYMACRRAVVAPRRETIAMIAENNRDALLFEPGDPFDLSRKVLRLLGEPALRDHLAATAYERVRRDHTASGARRAIRDAYAELAKRFAGQFAPKTPEPAKIEILADDEFEATVFEEPPRPPSNDLGLARMGNYALEEALSSLDNTGSAAVNAAPQQSDDTSEREAVPPGPNAWTPGLTPPPAHEDWVGVSITSVVRGLDEESADDGTPIEGVVVALAPPLGAASENKFVAGEIDVPTPPPQPVRNRPSSRDDDSSADARTPKIDLEGSGSIIGPPDAVDPDTGSRTPPIERR